MDAVEWRTSSDRVRPMRRLALLLALISLSVGLARADDDPATPFYVGAGIGHVSVDRGSISLSGANSGYINGTGTAVSVLGGYYFTDNLGVELGYHDYGKPSAFFQSGFTPTKCGVSFSCPQVSGVTAMLLGKVELVPQVDGILRLGMLEWNVGSPGGTLLGKTSGNAFIYGVGARRRFDYGLSIEVTYERSNFTTEETRLGVSYSF